MNTQIQELNRPQNKKHEENYTKQYHKHLLNSQKHSLINLRNIPLLSEMIAEIYTNIHTKTTTLCGVVGGYIFTYNTPLYSASFFIVYIIFITKQINIYNYLVTDIFQNGKRIINLPKNALYFFL